MTFTWQDMILEKFPARGGLTTRVTIVEDQDSLLVEESTLSELSKRDYVVVEFKDAQQIRYVFEHRIRNQRFRNLVIMLRNGEWADEAIPYELRRLCDRRVCISLRENFPNFHHGTMQSLNRALVPAIYEKLYLADFGKYNEKDTCEFVLEKCLGISASAVIDLTSFLICMSKIHFLHRLDSPNILRYFRDEVCARREFPPDLFAKLILSPTAFREFLQREWDVFMAIRKEHGELKTVEGLKGFPLVPFEEPEIRKLIGKLFEAGVIHGDGTLSGLQVQIAYLNGGEVPDADKVLLPFFARLETRLAKIAGHADWRDFSAEWAEFESFALSQPSVAAQLDELRRKINESFLNWLRSHYADLATVPCGSSPVMLHRVAPFLSRRMEKEKRVALIVVDGLAMNQWCRIRQRMKNRFVFEESQSFAWLPTLTSVSRQSIFSGKAPYEYASSIGHTNAEEKQWVQFWTDAAGLKTSEIFYDRNLGGGSETPIQIVEQIPASVRACGLVVNSVDNIMHGETLGAANFLEQVDTWASQGFLLELIQELSGRGFSVYLTSDHGNLGVTGIGKMSDGCVAETKGERVRVYESDNLRTNAAAKEQKSFAWCDAGLPENFKALMLQDDFAFLPAGESAVSHGGPSIEEVIVPFVHFEEKACEEDH